MEKAVSPFSPYWYVGHGEWDAYKKAGALNVIESGGLCESRNAALRDAFKINAWCCQISDDLSSIGAAVYDSISRQIKRAPLSFFDAISNLCEMMKADRAYLGGCAPTANPYFMHEPFKRQSFIVGDLILVKPCKIFFDQNLRLKEDYDYTLQHLETFGSVLRFDYILPSFAHRTNKGGAVEYRTSDREKEAIAYLQKKWPGVLVRNPRRWDEILLRWKGKQEPKFLKKVFR